MTIDFFGKNYEVPPDKIAINTAALHADIPNLNGDEITYPELEKSYKQYIGCPNVYVDHVVPEEEGAYGLTIRNDVQSRGMVKDAYLNPADKCLYLLIYVDKGFEGLSKAILSGALNAVSFGASADIVCGICGQDECEHIENRGTDGNYDLMMNPQFEEISIVFDPADPLALFKEVASSRVDA
ncbi:MAG: hypothetical protein IIZ04_00625 [Aeriscardovia sp.]|nr:hypothetical protein [Aeriscardovia sp.]